MGILAAWEQCIAKPPPDQRTRLAFQRRQQMSEVELAYELAALFDRDELPDLEKLTTRFRPRLALLPEVTVVMPTLAIYDGLLEAA